MKTTTVATQKVGLDERAYRGAPLEKRSTIIRVMQDAQDYGKQPAKAHWSFKSATERRAQAKLDAACEVSKAQRVTEEANQDKLVRDTLANMAKSASKYASKPAKSQVTVTQPVKPVVKAQGKAKAQVVSVSMQATLDKIARREAIQAKIAASGTKGANFSR